MAITLSSEAIITIAGSVAGNLTSFNVSASGSTVDITTFDSADRAYTGTALNSWTISAGGLFDRTDVGHAALVSLLQTGGTAALVVKPEGNTTGDMIVTATIIVESSTVASGDLDGVIAFDFSGTCTTQPVFTAVPA